MIDIDDKAKGIFLVPIGTGENFMTLGYSILGDIGEASYIKTKYIKEFAKFIKNIFKNYDDVISEVYNLSGFPSLEMQKMRSNKIMYSFFDKDITTEFLNALYEKIKDILNPALIRAMQKIVEYR